MGYCYSRQGIARAGTKLYDVKNRGSSMKKSTIGFEDFLGKLSEVRFNLEVDHHVHRTGAREKLYTSPSNAGSSKSPKRDSQPGGTGSGRYSKDRIETVPNRF